MRGEQSIGAVGAIRQVELAAGLIAAHDRRRHAAVVAVAGVEAGGVVVLVVGCRCRWIVGVAAVVATDERVAGCDHQDRGHGQETELVVHLVHRVLLEEVFESVEGVHKEALVEAGSAEAHHAMGGLIASISVPTGRRDHASAPEAGVVHRDAVHYSVVALGDVITRERGSLDGDHTAVAVR